LFSPNMHGAEETSGLKMLFMALTLL